MHGHEASSLQNVVVHSYWLEMYLPVFNLVPFEYTKGTHKAFLIRVVVTARVHGPFGCHYAKRDL